MLTAGNEMRVKLILWWGASSGLSGRRAHADTHTHTQTTNSSHLSTDTHTLHTDLTHKDIFKLVLLFFLSH